jgi:multiple sugar transport system substrate-binding protein
LLALCCCPAVAAAPVLGQSQLALAAVKALQASGELAQGATLRLTVKQGNIVSFLGRDFELQREWEAHTGVRIDARLMPQTDSRTFIAGPDPVDLTIARTHELAELYADGLIADLSPIAERHGFAADGAPPQGYLLLRQQAYVGDRLLAIPADADVPLLYLRRDLLEDSAHQARFQRQHGYALGVPRTWQEYLDQVAFFHRGDDGFFGCLEQRERDTGWMFWMQRYVAMSPTARLFDDDMRPLLESRAALAATENYAATVRYSPPAILSDGSDYSYTLPLFINGHGYSTIITPAGAKLFHSSGSKVRGRFITAPLPGAQLAGRLQRRSVLIYGNNLVVPQRSENKSLALLFAMWLTGPDVSARSVGVAGGFSDPYRYGHFHDERIAGVYTPEALSATSDALTGVLPAGTGMPGNAEYLAALNEGLWRVASGTQPAREAMATTVLAWEAITERHGREAQSRHYRTFTAGYPEFGRWDG